MSGNSLKRPFCSLCEDGAHETHHIHHSYAQTLNLPHIWTGAHVALFSGSHTRTHTPSGRVKVSVLMGSAEVNSASLNS